MTYVDKEIVRTSIKANNRAEVIAKFTNWVNTLQHDDISLSIQGIISGVPYEVPDEQV